MIFWGYVLWWIPFLYGWQLMTAGRGFPLFGETRRKDVRNVAIIAHVDHGKTTLVDALMKEAAVFENRNGISSRIMDSENQERSRGITILAKNTAIDYQGVKINIIDTPGHSDFGGEVERVMNMANSVLLVVDSVEGPKPQTKFVLKRAIDAGLTVVVVINKVDRPTANVDNALSKTFDLFLDLNASDTQADFDVVYASALLSQSGTEPRDLKPNMQALFEAIIKQPGPEIDDIKGPFQMLVSSTIRDPYKGKLAVGRVNKGKISKGDTIAHLSHEDKEDGGMLVKMNQISELSVFSTFVRNSVNTCIAGDIAIIAGMGDRVKIGDTLSCRKNMVRVGKPEITAPTVKLRIGPNKSPLTGKDPKSQFVTTKQLKDRLLLESEKDIALKIGPAESGDEVSLLGRGQLHLTVLLENLRQEGYEFMVSPPDVLEKLIGGKPHEPWERITCTTESIHVGGVMKELQHRGGNQVSLRTVSQTHTEVVYMLPTRFTIGLRSQLMSATRGTGMIEFEFDSFQRKSTKKVAKQKGSILSIGEGTVSSRGASHIQEHGAMFVAINQEVYKHMICGISSVPQDIEMNVTREPHVTNLRAAGKDKITGLSPPTLLSIDSAIEYITENEVLEVTPSHIRMAKRSALKKGKT